MSLLPDHTLRLADRLLAAYCQRHCPPDVSGPVVLGYRLAAVPGGWGFELHELRPICGVPGTARRLALAQFRYRAAAGSWRLYYAVAPDSGAADADGLAPLGPAAAPAAPPRWRRYPGTGDERNLATLLRTVDEDAPGLLWPRFNGASLRWCTARGRCAGCAQRYRVVLRSAPEGGPGGAPADAFSARGAPSRPAARAR